MTGTITSILVTISSFTLALLFFISPGDLSYGMPVKPAMIGTAISLTIGIGVWFI